MQVLFIIYYKYIITYYIFIIIYLYIYIYNRARARVYIYIHIHIHNIIYNSILTQSCILQFLWFTFSKLN